MIFSTSIIRKHVADSDFLFHTAPYEYPAPDHFDRVHCDQCKRPASPAKSQSSAVAVALVEGWSVKIRDGYKISGVFDETYLTENCDVFCPRCIEEWHD